MILRRLQLKRFGRFSDDSWEFGPGLNVVFGPNEAGKSTMREAIVRLLLSDKKVDTGDQSFLSLCGWGQNEKFVIEGTLQSGDHLLHLVRDFEQQRIELRSEPGGELLRDETLVSERLHELLGVGSRAVYETTACFAQQEFAQLEAGTEVSALLQQTLTGPGTESGATAVLGKLAKELSGLRRGMDRHAQNPGPVAAAERRIGELETQIGELSPIVARAEEARDATQRYGERIEQIDAELARAQRMRARAEKRREIDGELSELVKRCNELEQRERQAGRLSEEISRFEQRLRELPEVTREQVDDLRELEREATDANERAPELRAEAKLRAREAEDAQKRAVEIEEAAPDAQTLQRAREARREIDALCESLAAAREQAERASDDLRGAQDAHGRRRGWLIAAAALIVVGAGLALVLAAHWPWIIAGGGLAVGTVAALRGLDMTIPVAEERHEEYKLKVDETRAKIARIEAELDGLLAEVGMADVPALDAAAEQSAAAVEAAREERTRCATRSQTALEAADRAEQRAEIAQARLKGRVEQLQAQSVEAFAATAREVFELRDSLAEAKSKLRGVLGDRSLPEIGDELSDLSNRRRGLEQELETDEMAHAQLTPERYDALVTEIDDLSAEREQITGEIDEQRGAASHPGADPERLRQLQEQLEMTRERLRRHRERLAATELARRLLEQAHEETLSAAIDVLEPRTSELLSAITAGRYATVEFDRATLAPSVHSREMGDLVEADAGTALSCATREQIYLAARLALIDLLWPDSAPPILLDDPLVNFDRRRREEAVGIFRSFAADHQVILFTCHEHYCAIGDHLIELPAPCDS